MTVMSEILKKTKATSGADELTPSKAQYFSWINNTNEGSTEAHTHANFDYFEWMKEKYGMQLDIYAWDAGNLDGARGTYQYLDSPKIVKQFPNGYGPLAKRARELGFRMGVWCGAGGYGDTPESEKKRYDTFIKLCRDFDFGLFKIDTVCGILDESRQLLYKKMIDECRTYVPDLILLNHRNDLGKAAICATTFVWEGSETYTDVFSVNPITGPHHRVMPLIRGLTPDLMRLVEDHGCCISSCLDFFEDDLAVQAFSRSLILAPEIYGNPWFLRDDEQAVLANIYNLHRKYNEILVKGITLPESYGASAVSRGSGDTRILCVRNPSWEPLNIKISISSEIGLEPCSKTVVMEMLPYNRYVGTFGYGDFAEITVAPFRASVILVQEESKFKDQDFAFTDCTYETIIPDREYKIIKAEGQIGIKGNKKSAVLPLIEKPFDYTLKAPTKLGAGVLVDVPVNAETLYETTAFAADTDAFEAQSVKRSGRTEIPAVEAARKAFFDQLTYKYRGCEANAIFDGLDDTFFDANSRHYNTVGENRCLRVDLGKHYPAETIEIDYFFTLEPRREIPKQLPLLDAGYSDDLISWKYSEPEIKKLKDITAPVVVFSVHNIEENKGELCRVRYSVPGGLRYFRLPKPVDRIYHFRLFDEAGSEIIPDFPHANNMLGMIDPKEFKYASAAEITLPNDLSDDRYISAALDGVHGCEGAYCVLEIDGELIGAYDRAPSYPINQWEHICAPVDRSYTYYFRIGASMAGKKAKITALFRNDPVPLNVYLCHKNKPRNGVIVNL